MTDVDNVNVPAKHEAAKKSFALTDATYDFLRRVQMYLIPALGTFYSALALIWGLPYADKVVGTLAAFAVLLAVILGLSRRAYNSAPTVYDGEIVTQPSDVPGVNLYSVQVPLDAVQNKDVLTLKVTPSS